MRIAGCAAIVTGGASGLGEATARELTGASARVTVFDLDEEAGCTLATELGGLFVRVDVTDEASVEEGLATAHKAHGAARILVNCAGILVSEKITSRGRPHSLEGFEKVVRVNLTGTFNCIRLAATRLAAAEPGEGGERGVIVNTSSVAAFEGQMGQAAYAAAKGGIAGLTLPMARDLAGVGIRVMTIAPGIFRTPMMAGLPQRTQESLNTSVPFPPRLGEPAEYAALVRHICENPYLNGEIIRLDGAIRMPVK